MQWASFLAVVRFGAVRIGSRNLEVAAGALIILLIVAVSERISRAVFGSINTFRWEGAPVVAVAVTLRVVVFSAWLSDMASNTLESVITEFVLLSERAATK